MFIVERMDGNLYDFFTKLAPHLSDPKSRTQAITEINKIFTLVKNMNEDGIYHRDAHGGNLMYIETPHGLVWKFIDPETFYLAKEDFAVEIVGNGAFVTKIPLWIIPRRKNQPHSRRDERGRCGHSFRCTFLGSGRQGKLYQFDDSS